MYKLTNFTNFGNMFTAVGLCEGHLALVLPVIATKVENAVLLM